MPPRMSRLCQETRCKALWFPTQPRTAQLSTSSNRQAAIPPESPKFIEIPRQVQPYAIRRPWMKGVLPPPRKVFTQKPKDQVKATPSYLAAVTPEPLTERSTAADGRTKEFVSWKEKQAERRRQNLREGLIELEHREKRRMEGMAQRSMKAQAENIALKYAPEREDERLTNPSVLAAESPFKRGGIPDPNRGARLAHKKENLTRMQRKQEERRRENLHTLYVNAGSFITTSEQLDQAVDKAFDDLSQFADERKHGLNVWHLGLPETVEELLKNRVGSSEKALDSLDENAVISKERLKKIAEELTGGKIDDSRGRS